MKNDLTHYEAWLLTGSQHLYGEETLRQVADHAQQIARSLHDESNIPVSIVCRQVVTGPEGILEACQEANSNQKCVGLLLWMHTFSPAKMWIAGLKSLQKPFVHFHTQFNRDIPWAKIDMDFMNLNQSAHGGREFGFINARMRLSRKVITGHWQDPKTVDTLATWLRAAAAVQDMRGAKFARFGDNMRQVAVTEGDKVGAEIKLGISVNGYGMGDLAEHVRAVQEDAVRSLVQEYEDQYDVADSLRAGGPKRPALEEAASIELGIRSFLEHEGFKGFTDTFEDLHGLPQLPGIAVQRLMQQGYGFGAEGDWKTAALVRAMKVMAAGLDGGTSFMEDYTYHFEPGNHLVLGAHMLEICPSIAHSKPSCEIHPLSIGGKSDPVRLVFDGAPGPAINASIIDIGDRFRLVVNEVEATLPQHAMPELPVARALWQPKPDLTTAATSWIYAGGAHHTCYTQALTVNFMSDFAEILDIEMILINDRSSIQDIQNNIRWNEAYYKLRKEY
jgi:L-arabinose isomerase